MREPKFKTKAFSSKIKPLTSENKDKFLALASIDKLRPFIPHIDIDKNYDLLPVAFNACVVNRVNLNDDVITSETAVLVYKDFINKFINLEHDRSRIVGVILTAGFSKFGTDEPMTEEEAKNSTEPYNITLGGVIWRAANYELADVVAECDDPTSKHYLTISTSWELGFEDYDIVVLEDGEKNTENAEIISDKELVAEMEKHLRAMGGEGSLGTNKRVYRRIKGAGTLPMGVGLTENPAADVKGILSNEAQDSEASASSNVEEPTPSEIEASKNFENSVRKEIISSLQKYISQRKNINVKKDSIIMKIKSIKDVNDETLLQIGASGIQELYDEEVQKASEEFLRVKNEKDNALKASEEKYNSLVAEHEQLKASLKTVQEDLAKFKNEAIARENEEKFNQRMAALDTIYELTAEDRKVLASRLKDMDDEAYKAFESDLTVLMASKKKDLAPKPEAIASTTTTAVSEQETVETAVENAQPESTPVVATTTPAGSVKDSWADAFEIVTNKRK